MMLGPCSCARSRSDSLPLTTTSGVEWSQWRGPPSPGPLPPSPRPALRRPRTHHEPAHNNHAIPDDTAPDPVSRPAKPSHTIHLLPPHHPSRPHHQPLITHDLGSAAAASVHSSRFGKHTHTHWDVPTPAGTEFTLHRELAGITNDKKLGRKKGRPSACAARAPMPVMSADASSKTSSSAR